LSEFQLFFSNRSADAERVRELQAALRGLLPNLPFEDLSAKVPFDADWHTPALSLLKSCQALVCVVGASTYESEPVDWEIRQAHTLKKPILVTRLSPEYALPPSCRDIPIAEWDRTELAGRIGELLVSRALFPRHNWEDGPPAADVIWNQYNLMVQSWEALIGRRQTVNTLYLSADAALLAGVGGLASLDMAVRTGAATGAAILALLGLALSFNWRRTVVSYGILSRAKSKVVETLEAYMPARLFEAEWRVLEAARYTSTTDMDMQTAQFFMILFLALFLAAVGVAVAAIL
jgi:hypothetical protein